jgi:hypothetical protein
MVVELRHNDVGEQARPGAPASNRMVGRRRLHNTLAGAARERLADVAQDFEAARHVVERLRHVRPDPA